MFDAETDFGSGSFWVGCILCKSFLNVVCPGFSCFAFDPPSTLLDCSRALCFRHQATKTRPRYFLVFLFAMIMQLQVNGLLSFHIVWHNNEWNNVIYVLSCRWGERWIGAGGTAFVRNEILLQGQICLHYARVIKIIIRKTFERCNLNEKNAVYAPNRHESKLVI